MHLQGSCSVDSHFDDVNAALRAVLCFPVSFMLTKPLGIHPPTSVVALLFTALAAAAALEVIPWNEKFDSCSEGVVSRLYLGQNTPAGTVTDAQWHSFVTESLTPRFPAGFTELQADGHWRNDRGAAIEERTRIVEIAHDDAPAVRERIRAIATDYRHRFAQQSVLVTQFRSVYCFENETREALRVVPCLAYRGGCGNALARPCLVMRNGITRRVRAVDCGGTHGGPCQRTRQSAQPWQERNCLGR